MFWVGALVALVAFTILLLVTQIGNSIDRQEGVLLRWIASWRTGWMNRIALVVNGLGSTAVTRSLRIGTLLALIAVRRWRHLVVLLISILFVAWLTRKMGLYSTRPRPFSVRIIGDWEGSSFPSRPVPDPSVAVVAVV